jgi:hypothetical protein
MAVVVDGDVGQAELIDDALQEGGASLVPDPDRDLVLLKL